MTSEPASSCFRCHRAGFVRDDQTSRNGATKSNTPLDKTMRFECVCGNEWSTNTLDALAHGRFLDRSGLRR